MTFLNLAFMAAVILGNPNSAATSEPPPQKVANLIASNKAGEGSLNRDRYIFTYYTYTGDCPGSFYGSRENVSFRSKSTPPGQYQRVKITNTDTGGYTNREYDERRGRSEPFTMRWHENTTTSF